MSKGLSYFLGLITGVLLAVVGIVLLGLTQSHQDEMQKVYFDKPGKCISSSELNVMQVIDDYSAIAMEDFMTLMLIENPKGEYFYDER